MTAKTELTDREIVERIRDLLVERQATIAAHDGVQADPVAGDLFAGVEARVVENEHGHAFRVIIGDKFIEGDATFREVARRWNAEPGLRDESKRNAIGRAEYRACWNQAAEALTHAEAVSEARRRALDRLWGYVRESRPKWNDEVVKQVEDALAGRVG